MHTLPFPPSVSLYLISGLGSQDGVVLNATTAAYCNETNRILWSQRVPSQAISPCRIWDDIDMITPSGVGKGLIFSTFIQLQ